MAIASAPGASAPLPGASAPLDAVDLASATPGPARRLAARFALLAFCFYHLPLILNDYPSLGGGGARDDGLSQRWGHVFGQVGLWVARHVFQLTGPMPSALSGDNGDTAEEYGRLLTGMVVAAIVAVIWTVSDRRRPRARWASGALHVILRYAIALGLASYGMAKLYPVQFGPLSAVSLEMRVGELTPFALLWRFMEYSPVYSTFAGIMEMTVVVLLCFRRTATLGALICIPVMANVALLDLCYGVPVKLFAISMVVSAAVLVLYDARRLADVLVRRRAVPALPPDPPLRSRHLRRLRWPVKLVLVGGVTLSSAVAMDQGRAGVLAEEASPLHGTWQVDSFVKDGRELAQTADPMRWRRFLVTARGAAIRLEDDSLLRCDRTVNEAARTLKITCPQDHRDGSLRWTRDGDQLRVDGTFDHAAVTALLIRRDEAEFPLLHSRFHWISE
jgi:hypothetical protein